MLKPLQRSEASGASLSLPDLCAKLSKDMAWGCKPFGLSEELTAAHLHRGACITFSTAEHAEPLEDGQNPWKVPVMTYCWEYGFLPLNMERLAGKKVLR